MAGGESGDERLQQLALAGAAVSHDHHIGHVSVFQHNLHHGSVYREMAALDLYQIVECEHHLFHIAEIVMRLMMRYDSQHNLILDIVKEDRLAFFFVIVCTEQQNEIGFSSGNFRFRSQFKQIRQRDAMREKIAMDINKCQKPADFGRIAEEMVFIHPHARQRIGFYFFEQTVPFIALGIGDKGRFKYRGLDKLHPRKHRIIRRYRPQNLFEYHSYIGTGRHLAVHGRFEGRGIVGNFPVQIQNQLVKLRFRINESAVDQQTFGPFVLQNKTISLQTAPVFVDTFNQMAPFRSFFIQIPVLRKRRGNPARVHHG